LAKGMSLNGLQQDFIDSLIEQLKGFAHYGFPESHAASFALLAYASSYLKCHYPAAFFTALLNSQPMGFYPPHVLIQTARQCGVPILPICVNRSNWDASLERSADSDRDAIRLGLGMTRRLRKGSASQLVKMRRQHGPWSSIEDCLKCAQLTRPDATALAAAGAFYNFGVSRRSAIWLAEALPLPDILNDDEDSPEFPIETPWERVTADFNATTTSLGPHPTEVIRSDAWYYPTSLKQIKFAKDLPKAGNGARITVFGMLLVRQSPPSANGMVFATIEDESGLMNLVLTPPVYQQHRRIFDAHAFLCVSGSLQRDGGSLSVKVSQVHEPNLPEGELIRLSSTTDQNFRPDASIVPHRNYC
jgi:error-prone DNA polymerase